MKFYYHFTGATLRDGMPIPPIGEWLEHVGELIPCKSGLHASEHPYDALRYAPGHLLHRVELGGNVIPHGNPVDKVCARRRKILETIDAERVLLAFARRVALDVLPLWTDSPPVVRRFLETGDESLRAASRAAPRAAPRAASWAASRAASRAASWAASRAAARDASEAASRAAALAASQTAAREKYRQWFLEMVEAEFEKHAKGCIKSTGG